MINEKQLDEWERKLLPAVTATLFAAEARELIALARDGLQLEKEREKTKALEAHLAEMQEIIADVRSEFSSRDDVDHEWCINQLCQALSKRKVKA